MKYVIIVGALFSLAHLIMAFKSNLDFNRALKICKNITSKLKE